jgi:hypothetical protein
MQAKQTDGPKHTMERPLGRWFAKKSISQQIKTCVMHTGYVKCSAISESTESSQHALVCEKLGCRREISAGHRILVTSGAILVFVVA